MQEKILIVEDNPANGLAAIAAMRKLSLDAELICNAEEAITKIKAKNSYLAILSDMQIPIKKGGEINPKAGELVAKECIKKLIPCFIVTSGFFEHWNSNAVKVYDCPLISPVRLRLIKNFHGTKTADNWKKIWEIIEEEYKTVLFARERYIKYVILQKGE